MRTEQPGGPQSRGSQESDMTGRLTHARTHPHSHTSKDQDYLEEKYTGSLIWAESITSSCLTLPMDCNPPGPSIHGISQVRVLEWLPFPSPGNLPDPGIEPVSPALAGRFCTTESLRNITDTQISVTAQMLASSATCQGHAEQRGGWVTGDKQAPSPKCCLYSEYDHSQNSESGNTEVSTFISWSLHGYLQPRLGFWSPGPCYSKYVFADHQHQ